MIKPKLFIELLQKDMERYKKIQKVVVHHFGLQNAKTTYVLINVPHAIETRSTTPRVSIVKAQSHSLVERILPQAPNGLGNSVSLFFGLGFVCSTMAHHKAHLSM